MITSHGDLFNGEILLLQLNLALRGLMGSEHHSQFLFIIIFNIHMLKVFLFSPD